MAQKWVLHVDGDAFFASCEVAKNPSLKGRPVVTGLERGIASSLTYEAKARGIKRGMPLYEIRQICPEVVLIEADYESYSLYSKRMYTIVRRYSDTVEEYSIDECFAYIEDISLALEIKTALQNELGITFSVGVAPTKVLAKVGSKWQKPDGLTIIKLDQINNYLKYLPVDKVWGIGPATSKLLNSMGIRNSLEFINKTESWVLQNLSKPYYEIWSELRGVSVYEVNPNTKTEYKSISKTKTFTPTSNIDQIYAELSKNIENACIKARRYKLFAQKINVFLKTQKFTYHDIDIKLKSLTNLPHEILPLVKIKFRDIYKSNILYRASGVTLLKLEGNKTSQLDLFGHKNKLDELDKLYESIDQLRNKHGKYTVFLGSSLKAMHKQERKHIGLPSLGQVK